MCGHSQSALGPDAKFLHFQITVGLPLILGATADHSAMTILSLKRHNRSKIIIFILVP